MQQLVLTRDHVSIPWGFRLKGGSEYNVPLSILKVNDGSPALNQLDIGDIIVSIGQYPALNLKHEEALNIIRLFDVTLPMTIRRDQPNQLSKNTSSAVWRPSVGSNEQPTSPINTNITTTTNYDNTNYSAYAQQNNYEQQQEIRQEVLSPSVMVQSQVPLGSPKYPFTNFNYQHQYLNNNNNNNINYYNRKPQPSPPPPPAPPLPPKFNNYVYDPSKITKNTDSNRTRTFSFSNNNNNTSMRPATTNTNFKFNETTNNNNNGGSHIPDALLKAMNGPPMSTKPFTYTPGGLDLSHVRESSRVKRHEPPNPTIPDTYQRSTTPSYHQQLQQYYIQQQYIQQQELFQHQQQKLQQQQALDQQRYPTKFEYQPPMAFITPPKPRERTPVNVEANAPYNYDDFLTPPEGRYENKYSIRPVKATPKIGPGPPAPGFNITPEQIVRPKKREDDKDFSNQSYSFRMLNKWISDSESKTTPLEMIKSDQQTITAQPTVLSVKRTDVLIAVEEEEKKQKKLQMLQSSRAKDSASNVPSKVFKFIDRKFSTDYFEYPSVNTVNGQAEVSTPATPPTRYRGAEIPSKSFKQLQNMTKAAEASNSHTFTTQPLPVSVAKEAEAPPADLEVSAAEVQEVIATEVNNVQIEATTQPESETVEQPAESSFASSANEITNEATVVENQSNNESEKPAEPQPIEAQIEDVVAIIENLSLPEEPAPAPAPEPEPTPVVEEPKPTPPVEEPAPVVEEPVVEQPQPVPEPEIQQEKPQQTESQIEPNSSEATSVQSSNEAQDKNETSDF